MTLAWDVIGAANIAPRRRAVPIARAGILAREICRREGRGKVAAVFDRSLYVRAGDDFLCIGEPAIGNGPLTLIVSARVASLDVCPGQTASIAEQRIIIGDLLFDLDRCETWRPPRWPALSTAQSDEICAGIARRAAMESPPDSLAHALFADNTTPLARVARPRVRRFELWLSGEIAQNSSCPAKAGHPVRRDTEILSRRLRLLDPPPSRTMTAAESSGDAIASLIGLGPGLTPSGDDFLMGALAVLDALGQTKIHAALAQAIAGAAPALTSPLSACFLRAAAAGYVGARLHGAVASIVHGNVDAAVAGAQRIGHTSGWDMLAGVATTLRVVGLDYRTG